MTKILQRKKRLLKTLAKRALREQLRECVVLPLVAFEFDRPKQLSAVSRVVSWHARRTVNAVSLASFFLRVTPTLSLFFLVATVFPLIKQI